MIWKSSVFKRSKKCSDYESLNNRIINQVILFLILISYESGLSKIRNDLLNAKYIFFYRTHFLFHLHSFPYSSQSSFSLNSLFYTLISETFFIKTLYKWGTISSMGNVEVKGKKQENIPPFPSLFTPSNSFNRFTLLTFYPSSPLWSSSVQLLSHV